MKFLNAGTDKLWLLGGIIVSAVLQFSTIGWRHIWHDESFTAMLIDYDVAELLERAAIDVHPPLYYLLLKGWAELFGVSEAALRGFSAVFMIGAVAVTFVLVRHLLGSLAARAGLITATIGAFIVRYGMEMRMYGLAAFIGATATYLFVRLIDHSLRRAWWIVYAILITALIYTHYFASLLVVVHGLYLLLELRRQNPRTKWSKLLKSRPVIYWVLSGLGAAVLFLPWLPKFLDQASVVNNGFWIEPVNFLTPFQTLSTMLMLRPLEEIPLVAQLLLGVLLVWFVWATFRVLQRAKAAQRNALILMIGYVVVPALILAAVSLGPSASVYYTRYFSLFAPVFYATIGAICYLALSKKAQLYDKLAVLGVLAVLLVGTASVYLPGEFRDFRNDRYTMRDLAAIIEEQGSPDDVIISTALGTYFDIRYYNPTSNEVRIKHDGNSGYYGNWSLVHDRDDILLRHFDGLNPPSGHVWLVFDQYESLPDVPKDWQAVTPVIESGYAKIVRFQTN